MLGFKQMCALLAKTTKVGIQLINVMVPLGHLWIIRCFLVSNLHILDGVFLAFQSDVLCRLNPNILKTQNETTTTEISEPSPTQTLLPFRSNRQYGPETQVLLAVVLRKNSGILMSVRYLLQGSSLVSQTCQYDPKRNSQMKIENG